jgi:hypothetical protein
MVECLSSQCQALSSISTTAFQKEEENNDFIITVKMEGNGTVVRSSFCPVDFSEVRKTKLNSSTLKQGWKLRMGEEVIDIGVGKTTGGCPGSGCEEGNVLSGVGVSLFLLCDRFAQ